MPDWFDQFAAAPAEEEDFFAQFAASAAPRMQSPAGAERGVAPKKTPGIIERFIHGESEMTDPQTGASIEVLGAPGALESSLLGGASTSGVSLLNGVKAIPGVLAKLGGISKTRAGANIAEAVQGAKNAAVAADGAADIGLGMMDFKGIENVPRVAQSFMQRVTDPAKGPLGVEEARRYLTSMGGQSANELSRMSPNMRRQLIQMQKALGDAITKATEAAGTGEQYVKGMNEYRRGSKAAHMLDDLKPELKRLLKWGAGAAGLGSAYQVFRD